jgi:hypothetical protein
MQPSQALALVLALVIDVCGVAAGLWVARRRALAPAGAQALIVLGLLVAGLGLVTATLAPALAGLVQVTDGNWSGAEWQWATAVLGLLLVGAGTERLTAMPRRSRRPVRVLEGAALAITIVGAAGAVAATAGVIPAEWVAGGQTTLLATAGWATAIAGATGAVVANASGRFSGLVPYGRRVALGLAAIVFGAGAAAGPLVEGWLAGIALAPWAAQPLSQAVAGVGLVLLAWSARRALDRPRAADYWRRAKAAPNRWAVARARAQQPTRIAPSLPVAPLTEVPAVSVPLALAATLVPAAPFTPPVLRRGALLDPAPQLAGQSRSTAAPNPVAGPLATVLPAHADAAAVKSIAQKLDAVALDLERQGNAAQSLSSQDAKQGSADVKALLSGGTSQAAGMLPVADAAPRSPLSPQFVAALIRLQTEMARVGRSYEFAELVSLFSDVRPRATSPLPEWSNSGVDLEPLPLIAPPEAPAPPLIPTQTPEARPPDEPPALRLRPHILP